MNARLTRLSYELSEPGRALILAVNSPRRRQRERAWTTLMTAMQIQAMIVANVPPTAPS